VTGVYHAHPPSPGAMAAEQCNLADYRECKELLRSVKPDAVIHAAANPNPNTCQERPDETRRINVDASISIAGLCADLNIPLVFISTDLVFDGKAPPYSELSAPSPVNRYGEQKLEAERTMAARYGRVVICRMPLMFGDAAAPAQSFIQPMVSALRSRAPIALFTDEYRTPASGISAAKGILLALDKIDGGIIHLGGRERISRYDFGLNLARACGIENPVINAVRQEDVKMAAKRPPDVSFDSSKAFAMGFDPLPIDEELKRLACVKPQE
jgi:dTDP-4-dehydrorhamnose reductase